MNAPPLPRETLYAVVRIVLLYALFAALWILLSDTFVAALFPGPANTLLANTLKGLLFVAVTAVLLFFLIRRFAARRETQAVPKVGAGGTVPPFERRDRRGLLVSLAVLTVVFVLLGSKGLSQNREFHRKHEVEQLQAIARLKVAQIESWLAERRRDIEMVRSAPVFGEILPQWQASGDARTRVRLLARLERFRHALGYGDIAIVAANGTPLLHTGAAWHDDGEIFRDATKQAMAEGALRMTEPLRREHFGPAHAHIDFVEPIAGTAAAIALRVDIDSTLYPLVESWPLPSASGENVLFRRDGDALLFLSDLRHDKGSALVRREPLDAPDLLSARALASGYRPGDMIEGRDYRGHETLGVALPVEGTPWWLIAKLDRDEILAEAQRDGFWILLASLLSWLAALAFAALFFQRRELLHAQREQMENAEKLNALQLLAAVADSSLDAIYAKDRQGRYTLFNRATANFTGKTEAEVLGQSDATLFPPDELAALDANDRRVMDGNQSLTYEETVTTTTGVRNFLAVKGPLHDENGAVIGMYGISRDITELKQAEESLRESEAFVKSVLDNLPVGIAVNSIGPPVRFNYMNDNFPRFYRTTRERLADPDAFWEEAYADPQYRAEIRARVLADCASGDPARMRWDDIPVARPGEPTTYISAHNIPLPGKGMMISMVWDVTERKLAENALRESEEIFGHFMENSPIYVFFKDENIRSIRLSRNYEQMLGKPVAELLGKNMDELFPSALAKSMVADDQRILREGRELTVEEELNGRFYTTIKFPIRIDGQPRYLAGYTIDITEKKRIDAELDAHRHHLEELVNQRTADLEEARRRAEDANAAKSTFLANMSHEIRTPMNAIVGLAHLMQRHIADPAQRERLDKIIHATHHLLALINDILDLSKIEAGKMALETMAFDLIGLLEHVAAMQAETARQGGLELVVDIDPALAQARHLRGDATRLRQILLNYLGNALKFTAQGSVTLRARRVEDGADDVLLRFEVADTGIGIEPADQARLFQAFEQSDASITRRFGGSGLGLVINRRLAELMGGTVGVESTPGVGSRFWVTVRLQKDAAAAQSAALPAPTATPALPLPAGARILVAEDNPINQVVACELLTEAGLTVDLAEQGAQAVAMAKATAYDAILMDVQMPVMDGIEATRRIRALPGRAATPILAMTANAFGDDRRRCLDAGMNDYIAKPVEPEVLFALLRRWLPQPADMPEASAATGAADTTAAAAEDIDAALDQLETLLARDDAATNPFFAQIGPQLHRAAGPDFFLLKRAIDAYDYPAALAQLRRLRNSTPPAAP